MKKKIFQDGTGEYFLFHGKHYLKDIDSRGFDKRSFVGGQYASNFKVISFDKKYVTIEEIITNFKLKIKKRENELLDNWYCRCENSKIKHDFKSKRELNDWYNKHNTIYCYPYRKGGIKI